MRHKATLVIALALAAVMANAADGGPARKNSKYVVGPSVQPLVILGEGWTQQFVFVNVDYYSSEPTIGTLTFRNKDGQPWRLPLKGRGSVDHVDLNIKSGQMLMLETEVQFTPQVLGWAELSLSKNTNEWGIYRAYTVFRKQTAGQPDLMTSVPFVEGLEDEWIIPFDNEDGKYAGIGLVNSGSSATMFVFDVYDISGSRIKSFTKTIVPRGLAWFALTSEHPESAGRRGQIKISGGLFSSAAFTLQFAGNGAFTALPIVHTFGMK